MRNLRLGRLTAGNVSVQHDGLRPRRWAGVMIRSVIIKFDGGSLISITDGSPLRPVLIA